jgi:hypothetical protein
LYASGVQAVSPGGCTGAAAYKDGRFLGYKIASNDPVVGYWVGPGFGNHTVSNTTHESATASGISEYRIKTDGTYEGGGWGRSGRGPLMWEPTYLGNVYCLNYGRVYAAWNDGGIANQVGYMITMNAKRDIGFVKDIIASSSQYSGSHEMNAIIKFPDTVNLTDAGRVMNDAVMY